MMSFYLSGGVEVLGFISPTEPTDEYPVIDPLYGIDGFRNVNTLSELNSIPNLRRRAGMVVGVSGGTQYYKLNPQPWNGTITDWSVFNSGGGSGGTFTGGTVTGDTIFTQGVTATTFSASTYLGLPLDVYVPGGTYSDGTLTFTNNSGGTFNVSGLNTGTTINLSGGTGISVSGTSPNFIVENTLPDQIVNLSGGTNINVTGTYPNFNIEFTGVTSSPFTGGTVTGDTIFTQGVTATTFSASTYLGLPLDIYTTGFTFNPSNYDISIERNDGTILTQNLSILASDVTITGGTYNPLNGVATFTNNTGGTFTVSGFLTGFTDIQVTGYTYQDNTFKIFDSSGNVFSATINVMTGLTINGNLTVTGTTSLQGLSATTISATTIGNSGNCVSDLYVSNIHSCSPLNINPLNEGNVYFGSTSGVTIDLTNNRVGIGTSTPNYKLHIRGSGSTSASTAFYVENSLQSKSFVIRDDNSVDVGPTSGISQLNVSNPTFSVGTNVGYNPIYGSNVDGVFQVTNTGTFGTQVWIRPSSNPSGFNGNYWSYLLHSGYTFTVGSGRYVDLILRAGENGSATNTYFENNTGVRTMTISGSTGNVGIGTTTPSEKLDVNGKTKTINLQVTSGATAGYILTAIDSSGNTKWEALGSTSNELDPVLTIIGTTASTVNIGDRFLISGGTGIWSGRTNQIAEYTGVTPTDYSYYIPVIDDVVFVTDTLTTYRFDGTNWVAWRGTAILQNGNSLTTSVNIGTNNNQNLNLRTSGQTRVSIDTSGSTTLFGRTTLVQPQSSDYLVFSSSTLANSGQTMWIRQTGANTYAFGTSLLSTFMLVGPGNVVNFAGQRIQTTGAAILSTVRLGDPNIITLNGIPSGVTAGTQDFRGILVNPTVNFGGTYSGNFIGYLHNPTITSMANGRHIAMQIVSGDVLLNTTSGNVGIGATTPTAKLDVRGSSVLGTTTSDITTFGNGIILNFNTSPRIFSSSTIRYQSNDTTRQHYFVNDISSGLGGTIVEIGNGSGTLGTTTNNNFLNISGRLVSTSGANDSNAILISSQVGNGGTYSGVTRGLYYNPSIIGSGFTHRALETTTGDVIFGSTSGNVGIGTTTPSEKLDVSGKTKTINLQVTSGATTGYLLTSDASGNATWQVPSVTANTFTTGFTYLNNTFTIADNSGSTYNATINSVTGLTVNGNLTVTGNTSLQGLTATTISATTYQNLPVTADTFTTGFTYSNNTFTIVRNQGQPSLTATINSVTGLTVNGNLTVTGNTSLQSFTGTTGLISANTQNVLTIIGSGNSTTSPIFKVQGSQGELFSISDSLTGSLFSVNDISGLPILEVFSDNTTLMGSYLAPSLNTTARVIATTGTTNVYSIPTSAYTGAFFDYTVSDGTNLRAGNIMSIWSGTSVNYSETSTTDFGNTSGLTFNMVVSSGNAILRTSGTTGNWTVKTIVRSI